MASRSTNTMAEALQKLMRDIADMKTLGDADVPWLIELENLTIERLTRPVQEMRRDGTLPQTGAPQQSGGGGGGVGAGTQQGGLMAGPSAPNPDELSRVLSQING